MKVAIIMVGRIAYDKESLEEITRCYDLNDSNTDIFIYNNSTIETNNKLMVFFGENKIKCLKTIHQTYHEIASSNKQNELNNTIINNFKNFHSTCINNNIIDNPLISVHVPFKNNDFHNNPFKSSFSQYYQIYLALQEIIAYEKIHNMKYDFIMKIRGDFYLKHDKFGPSHYFNDNNDILLKSYHNLKYYYEKIDESDSYHPTEFRINNYLYWRVTKFLGGQYVLNKNSYEAIENDLTDGPKNR